MSGSRGGQLARLLYDIETVSQDLGASYGHGTSERLTELRRNIRRLVRDASHAIVDDELDRAEELLGAARELARDLVRVPS